MPTWLAACVLLPLRGLRYSASGGMQVASGRFPGLLPPASDDCYCPFLAFGGLEAALASGRPARKSPTAPRQPARPRCAPRGPVQLLARTMQQLVAARAKLRGQPPP